MAETTDAACFCKIPSTMKMIRGPHHEKECEWWKAKEAEKGKPAPVLRLGGVMREIPTHQPGRIDCKCIDCTGGET